MVMKRIEINTRTGEETIITLSQVEEDAALAASVAIKAEYDIADKAAVLSDFRGKRDIAIGRLNGISYEAYRAGDTATVTAIDAAIQGLKDMPAHATVIAATGGDETEDALQVLYYALAGQLAIDSPYAYTAFRGLDA